MKITREVITDLLPVYLAGEASADTQKLVDEFLQADPEFAKLIAEQNKPLAKTDIELPKEHEMKTLENTKSLLRKRSVYLAFAIFFTLFTITIRFDEKGVQWIWAGFPMAAAVCVIIGALMWVGYARTIYKLKDSGL